MAKNEVYERGESLLLAVPEGTVSGDPVVAGSIPGVAMFDRDSAGKAMVKTTGVFTFSVKGVDGSGNSAVAVGDILYYVSGDTPKISKKATGVRFGYALQTITSGSTATIQVKLGY